MACIPLRDTARWRAFPAESDAWRATLAWHFRRSCWLACCWRWRLVRTVAVPHRAVATTRAHQRRRGGRPCVGAQPHIAQCALHVHGGSLTVRTHMGCTCTKVTADCRRSLGNLGITSIADDTFSGMTLSNLCVHVTSPCVRAMLTTALHGDWCCLCQLVVAGRMISF